jgi:Fe-S cluster assembly protein SufD
MMSLKKKQVQIETDIGLTDWDEFTASGQTPDWMRALRLRCRDAYAAVGLPTGRMERFKYTNIADAVKNMQLSFDSANVTPSGCTEFLTPIMDASFPSWARAWAERAPVGAETYGDMNLWHAVNAYLRDGFALDVPANTTEREPLHITINGHDGAYIVPRTFLRIGANAEFTIIEHHHGEGAYWNNRVTQIHLEKGARLRHYRIQENSDKAVYTQNTHVTLDRDATYEAFNLTKGAAFSRNQIHVELQGENAEARLGGVNLMKGTQFADTTITIEHQAPHCRSNQTYKSILDDKSHGVFQGKVHVHRPAQKTDGYQLSNTLLLSPQAQMDTKPELEIYADDVKCSHGATTGRLDLEPLFYLRTRGLSEAQAKFLLMQAYLGPALDEIRDEKAHEEFSEIAVKWLEKQSR